jgi:drug/metabolite transporter (DMT)-like permease
MVTLADGQYSDDPAAAKQSVAGDMLCLLSAVVYGAYTVSIRWVGGGAARVEKGGNCVHMWPANLYF